MDTGHHIRSLGMFYHQLNLALKLGNGNVLAQEKVHHSMAFNLPPSLRPWVAFNSAGGVITAHCDCIASLGECCSHVGAILSSNKLTEKYINRY
ncbi:Uncharacterized protein APZ42_020258 [Daphnia magna]|uniref:SWIM-type domain-containing protein n=1 Tax=Daphnia magna TaxID=35525 RepID=A0A162CM05_9CRUS|nr:Uncharacterized protein APZ42_020258 [Daphnia magna]